MGPGFGLLGRTVIRVEGANVADWGRPRDRALLTALLVQPGRALSLDVLADWIWSDQKQIPQNPVSTIQTYATRVRKVLNTAEVPATLVAEGGKYRLQVDRAEVDYFVFRELITHARSADRNGRFRDAMAAVVSAIELWRGDPLADLTSEQAANWRRRVIEEDWIPANALYVRLLRELGRPEAALAHIGDTEAEHGDHHLSLIDERLAVLTELGRYADATTSYMRARRRFLADGDDQAAEHLRRTNDKVRGGTGGTTTPRNTEARVPRGLPHAVPDFVGRVEALRCLDETAAAVGDQLATVIAMDGQAGIGKTTLATHWARRVRDQFPDGDLYVDLNGYGAGPPVEPSAVVDQLLEELEIPVDRQSDARMREVRLGSALAGRRLLILLDSALNSDHVLPLLPVLSGCLVLVTSRRRLNRLSAWRGARHIHVPPLAEDDSTRLLTARLAVRGTARSEDVAALVDLCGGLPLTVNVVADHLAGQPSTQLPQAIALLRRDGLLHIGETGAVMATLGSVLAMSYRTLDPQARRMLCLLGLHPGSEIELSSAAALGGLDVEAARTGLEALFATHLAERADQMDRYRLHDLVREFATARALEELSPEQRHDARERLLSFLLASAQNALRSVMPTGVDGPPDLPVVAGVVPRRFADAADAEAWCLQESPQLDAAIAAAAEHGHPAYAWRLPHAIAPVYDRHGRYRATRANLEIAVRAAHDAGEREAEASSLSDLGQANLVLGEYTTARACLLRSWRMAHDEGYDIGQAASLHHLARLDVLEGDLAGGIDRYRRSLDAGRRADDLGAQYWTVLRLGDALRGAKQYDEATQHLHEAAWLSGKVGDDSARATALAALGDLFAQRGDHTTADAYFGRALDLATRIRDLAIAGAVCKKLAESLCERGSLTNALGYARRAVDLQQRTGNVREEADALEVLGNVHFGRANLAAAKEGWQRADDLLTDLGITVGSQRVQGKLAALPPDEPGIPQARTNSPPSGRGSSVSAPRLDSTKRHS
jgi:tetratricopeptide (TPR) repeat protein/DNA-binding SARP family transcriptional activator/Fe2+ transport system protein FeoA